ncbi:MAG: permease [Chloroflexi bacterium]|nr:permease [Chloroflexota bacterium]
MFAEEIGTFTTIFLGIFIEAVPFLLLGTVASGLVEVFVSQEDMAKMMPRKVLPATLMGGVMGFVFPVCECGVIPLTRRMFNKGLPLASGIAFLLAAPILNPVVLASTFAAYGFGVILVMRFVMGLAVAIIVGLLFSLHPRPVEMMRPQSLSPVMGGSINLPERQQASMMDRLRQAMRIAADEFFEMGRWLVIGCVLAAAMQTLVPQSTLTALGTGPVISVVVMMVLGYVLSVCSTVDAFVSLAFVNTFSTGSILSFLVFGPMVDIKSTLMYLGVFKRKYVLYIVVLPFLVTMLFAVFINLNIGW